MSDAQNGRPIEILLVEDNAGDIRLTREALREAHLGGRLHVVENGADALRFLRQEGPYPGVPRPDLILLDLNLPAENGLEVLSRIKADGRLKTIPVVILTSSQSERDIAEAYNLQANCYVTKPLDLDGFIRVIESIEDFWLGVVRLPAD